MKFLVLILLSLTTLSAFAGESGYLWQGKTYVTYLSGAKKLDPPAEALVSGIRYEMDDNGVICYWKASAKDNTTMTCLKK